MANFKTHVIVATAVSGMLSVTWLSLQLASPWSAGGYFLLGVIGGLLPDIDSDKSAPLTAIFFLLSLYCAFAFVFNLAVRYSYLELIFLWFALYFGIRYLVLELFNKSTLHRGVFHSLLAVLFIALIVANIGFYMLAKPAHVAWNCALFTGVGYLVHLTLDELYSVDLLGRRMKKSFGTALKPFSLASIKASLLMFVLICGLSYSSPPFLNYWSTINQTLQRHNLKQKWLPVGREWFQDLFSN